ncbi:MAG: penicillin acylase family protein [Rhodopirellula sp.]|nr:penicillin acylase family protein [Rhodopirellula sp.]
MFSFRIAILFPVLAGLALGALPASQEILAAETVEQILERARAALAQVEGEIKVPGLREPVAVLRDRWGVPHIYAQNSHDLFFAQGFAVAQDRLFQLDWWRRVGSGEMAEVLGESAIAGDRFARLMLYRGDMQAEWTSYSPDTRDIAAAFTEGINACIDHFGDRLPIEFQILGYRPRSWKPEDVLARMSGMVMVGNWQREIARARLIANVGVERARLVAPTDPPRAFAPEPGLDLDVLSPAIFEGYRTATRGLRITPDKTESNNWVVDGSLSASGKPMLASDPHRATSLPSLRYLVHLNAPGWNVIGAGEPALPGVAIGHNDRVAWGFTIVGTDQADVFVEETHPDNPRRYKVGDRWEPMHMVRDTIRVRGRSTTTEDSRPDIPRRTPEPPTKILGSAPAETFYDVTVELRFTRHGAVIWQDEQRHVACALKWVGSEPGSAAYLASLAVARSHSVGELVKALEAWKVPALNFVFADVEGQIGWVAAGLTPIRSNWDGLLPMPGASGKYEWRGFLDLAHLPQVMNPSRHWIATANHNILPAGYEHAIAYDWAPPYRFERIRQRLDSPAPGAAKKLTLEDFQSIQHENTSLLAQQLTRLLQAVALPDQEAHLAGLLTDWDGVLSVESTAAALYSVWLQELQTLFYAPHLPADAKVERGDLRNSAVLLEQLRRPDERWFGPDPRQARDDLLKQALTQAIARTKKLLGEDPKQWSWGRLHTATFRHPLATLGPAHAQAFNLGPVPRPGDVTTPNNTRANENFEQVHGATYRQVIDLSDWDGALATSAPGQSGQPGSPHYGDLLPLWAEARYFSLFFSRCRVEEVTRHRLSLRP